MEIRKANINEVEQIANIMKQIMDLHTKSRPDMFKIKTSKQIEGEVLEALKDDNRIVLVAIEENKIYGVLICKIKYVNSHINLKDSKSLWIDELGVDEKYKKRGIGKMLMQEAEKIAKENKCERLELNCWNFNEVALEFYKKQGIQDQRIIMEKRLEE